MRILDTLLAFSISGAVAACGAPGTTPGDGGGGQQAEGGGGSGGQGTTTSGASTTTTLEPNLVTLSASVTHPAIAPGDEAVMCVTVALDNADPVIVRRFRTTLNEGSHHMIVYKSLGPPNPTPQPCSSFGVQGGSAIFIAQQAQSELVFPTDPSGVPVGLPLDAHQALTIEIHYLNPTAASLDVTGTVEADVLPADANVLKSGFLFQGTFSVPEIPAFGEADTGVMFQGGIPGTHVFALTTHQHHLGTQMRVWHANDIDDLSTLVADSVDWSDPPLEMFDPPLDFPENGTKGFAYQCHWANPTATPVHGGLSANDEMCFFWSYYYPAL